MGIQGLLPLLKSIMVPIQIKDLNGCCVAVDTYSWLHKGALSCSKELCKGEPTSRHIDYCMHRVNLLRHHGIKPILVFDGGFLPMKSEQENKRSRARKENLERAIEHESTGNSAVAYECYQKAVDITPLIAYDLIQVLKKENIDYIVAPYEADAQMAFLALTKQVDAVITEDSDLIPFGCPRIIFKMDKFGQGIEFQHSLLQKNKELNFTCFTKQMLLEMCILSGCDYLQSLPGMGLKRAHSLIMKFKSHDKVIKHLRYSTVAVPPLYEQSFKKAIWTFQFQRVYDPKIEDIVHLSDLPEDLEDNLDFLGPLIPQDIVKGIARGDLDPFTKMPFQVENVHAGLAIDRKYPLKDFKPEGGKKKLNLPAQKNVVTNYFCIASLEAKRKFKVPRITTKNINSVAVSSDSGEHITKEADVCTISCPNVTLLESEKFHNAHSPTNFTEGHFASIQQFMKSPSFGDLESPEYAVPLQKCRPSIHESSLVLQGGRGSKSVLDLVEGETRSVNRKVIVRSSYFKNNLKKESDLEKKMLTNKNALDNKDEELFVDDATAAAAGVICGNVVPVTDNGFENENLKGLSMKRKAIAIGNVSKGIFEAKHTCTDASLPGKSDIDTGPGTRFTGIDNEDRKFGCNISHINHYSDIAEKSMERFISVMSSFRYPSSGSRASGLRAPLKDVGNTCEIRSTIQPVDLSKFSYVPNS